MGSATATSEPPERDCVDDQPLKYIGYGGTGKQVRDVLHVADLAELVDEQLTRFDAWDGWLGNVGGERAISASLQELTAICREVVGNAVDIASDPRTRQADLRIFLADCRTLHARTPWRPKRDVRQIVVDVCGWVRENEAALRELV